MLFPFPRFFYCQLCNRQKEFYLLIRLIDLIDWLTETFGMVEMFDVSEVLAFKY